MVKSINLSDIKFRIFQPTDDIGELNKLLLSAYRPLAEQGMRYAASHEDENATKKNVDDGECHIAIYEGKMIACAILRIPKQEQKYGWKANGPKHYSVSGVTTFGRFAVPPKLQGQGVGSKLMDIIESRAQQLGFSELALDTSEHATHLIRMYEKRGYKFIEFHQWDITNYRSVVMSKRF
jgi:GNAT superfamily N-acetyltransferase